MRTYLAAAAILLASAGAASSQTVAPCTDSDLNFDTSGSCAAAPSISQDNLDVPASPGIDPGTTSSIRRAPTPLGMAPLVVPNDPLGQSTGQNPIGSGNSIGGSQTGTFGNGGNSGITSPAIR
jgi:hypothetical protein